MPYDKAELSQLLLCMCHSKWQDQFNLIQGFILQNLCGMIKNLKNTEQYQESTKIPGEPWRQWQVKEQETQGIFQGQTHSQEESHKQNL